MRDIVYELTRCRLPLVGAIACLILGLLASTASAEDGQALSPQQKKAVFLRLQATYKGLQKDHSERGGILKRNLVEEVGELGLEASVSFIDMVLREERDLSVKVACLVALGRVGTLRAVQTAFKNAMNKRADDILRDALPWGMRYCHDEKAAAWVARKILRSPNASLRLAAIESLGRMGCKAGLDGLLKAVKDRDAAVAYEAARGLGMIGDPSALPTLFELSQNEAWHMREAAAFAFGHFEDEGSFAKLVGALKDEAWQVRESAVLSIRHRGGKPAALELMEALRDSPRRVAVEIADGLREITGKDFGFDADLWKSWWAAKGRDQIDAPKKPELTATYHGVKITSDHVLFIIDTSGSMEWGDRMSGAKKELAQAIRKLDGKTRFNIMTFANSPMFFRKEMVPALPEVLDQADEWLLTQRPFGGTNTYDTLKKAVEEIKGVDTIFFLSDGVPSDGMYINQEKILAEVNKLNRFRKIRIHTIAFLIGQAPAGVEEDKEAAIRFMRRLAEENHGNFVNRSE